MRIYLGIDDTDSIEGGHSTSRVARDFESKLPPECTLIGIVRQQLLKDDDINYTSHNSALCFIVEAAGSHIVDSLIERATSHLKDLASTGSDPGLCVAAEDNPSINSIVNFAKRCVDTKVTVDEAIKACQFAHIASVSGENHGVIGAAAAVGLTYLGQCGRFVEIGGKKRLRDFPRRVSVKKLNENGISVLSVDRNAKMPLREDIVDNKGWLRPRLWGAKAILPVVQVADNRWETLDSKKRR